MSFVEIVGASKDAVLAVAGIIAAVVAVRGLASWTRELKGRAAFEVARAYVRATFALRNSVERARTSWMDASEIPPDDSGVENRASRLAFAYENRLKPVYAAVDDFDAQSIEAEALLGPEVKRCNREVHRKLIQLRGAFGAIVDDARGGGRTFANDFAFRAAMYATASGVSESDDHFAIELEDIISRIEAIVRPHLVQAASRSFFEWLGGCF